jgi:hypothetical protein
VAALVLAYLALTSPIHNAVVDVINDVGPTTDRVTFAVCNLTSVIRRLVCNAVKWHQHGDHS